MHRLRLFPILGGEDEPEKREGGEDTPTREELRALQEELRSEQALRKRVEDRLLDPTYVEFLTTRMKGEDPAQGRAPAKPEGEEGIDLDAMSTKQLVQYLNTTWEQRAA